MLSWIVQAHVEAIGRASLQRLRLISENDFRVELKRISRHQRPERRFTKHGCRCLESWTHCTSTFLSGLNMGRPDCQRYENCPDTLGYCKTTFPCGIEQKFVDQCDVGPVASTTESFSFRQAGALSSPPPQRANELDVQAGTALWLHDIFERQPFETVEDDPLQQRRNALLQFVEILCAYFPDHLDGRESASMETRRVIRSETSSECRESLCELGGIIQDQWDAYTEMIPVIFEKANSANPAFDLRGPPTSLMQRSGHALRIKWQKLETAWQLCGRPWTEISSNGFADCQADDPLAKREPCGVWALMHGVFAELAVVHECTYTVATNVDKCIGPPSNATRTSFLKRTILQEHIRREEKEKITERLRRNATLPEAFNLQAGGGDGDQRCFRPRGVDQLVGIGNAYNQTLSFWLSQYELDGVLHGFLHTPDGLKRVRLQLISDRPVGGRAIVSRILEGPLQQRLQTESWMLVRVGGSKVPLGSAVSDGWQKMLRGAAPGETELIFEGPVQCPHIDDHTCAERETPCASFSFTVLDKSKPDVGRLKETSTGACLTRLYSTTLFFFTSDLGFGLTHCDGAPLFSVERHRFLRNTTFRSQEDPPHIAQVQQAPKLPDEPWAPVVLTDQVPAIFTEPFDAVQKTMRMVSLLWPCKVCRDRFLVNERSVIQAIKHPKDAVMWLWRTHNQIARRLKTETDRFPFYPAADDGDRPTAPWPSPSLCPACWRRDSEGNPSTFDEQKVYHFLVFEFYASKTTTNMTKHNATSLSLVIDAWSSSESLPSPPQLPPPQRRRQLLATAAFVGIVASATPLLLASQGLREGIRSKLARCQRSLPVARNHVDGYMPVSTADGELLG
eukprot:TRINITY_DN23929_c0_g2_i1.p1 TRINITY_DN23929_c0_g2~~TRINITY_DN23929_c0_g2_i1.p1  ORF type:complete len:887 (-),score=123.16 TRINITY_DN23929_c0_g2_i1:7-2553(-)